MRPFDPDSPPWFHPQAFPHEEGRHLFQITSKLGDLNGYITRFSHAIELHDFGARESDKVHATINNLQGDQRMNAISANMSLIQMFGDWRSMAAHDGAMTIYHFGKTIEIIKEMVHASSILPPLLDRGGFEPSKKLWNQHFSSFEDIRNAVAHSAELTRYPKRAKKSFTSQAYRSKNLKVDEGAVYAIRGGFDGRKFIVTMNNKLLSYEVGRETTERLIQVKRAFYGAFVPASQKLSQIAQAKFAEKVKGGSP